MVHGAAATDHSLDIHLFAVVVGDDDDDGYADGGADDDDGYGKTVESQRIRWRWSDYSWRGRKQKRRRRQRGSRCSNVAREQRAGDASAAAVGAELKGK